MFKVSAKIASILAAAAFMLPQSNLPAQAAKEPATLSIAAAADLKFAMAELQQAFEADNKDIKLKINYGASGNFFTQLSNGAPFDMFMSADMSYPEKLVEKGLADKDSLFQYAVGEIVIWVPNSSKIDLNKPGMDALLDPSIKKIAIANPKHAPYGRAAEAALKKLGVYDKIESKLVLGENIAQTAQYAESGAADVGVLAISLAMSPNMKPKGRYVKVPLDAYPEMRQGAVFMSASKNKEAAKLLVKYMNSEKGKKILYAYGFSLPEKK